MAKRNFADRKVIHLVEFDNRKMPYYKCNKAVGVADLVNITEDKRKESNL